MEHRCLFTTEQSLHGWCLCITQPTLILTRQVLGEQTVSPLFLAAFDMNQDFT